MLLVVHNLGSSELVLHQAKRRHSLDEIIKFNDLIAIIESPETPANKNNSNNFNNDDSYYNEFDQSNDGENIISNDLLNNSNGSENKATVSMAMAGSASMENNNSTETDQKVIEFLKILEEYRVKCEGEGNYLEAGRFCDTSFL